MGKLYIEDMYYQLVSDKGIDLEKNDVIYVVVNNTITNINIEVLFKKHKINRDNIRGYSLLEFFKVTNETDKYPYCLKYKDIDCNISFYSKDKGYIYVKRISSPFIQMNSMYVDDKHYQQSNFENSEELCNYLLSVYNSIIEVNEKDDTIQEIANLIEDDTTGDVINNDDEIQENNTEDDIIEDNTNNDDEIQEIAKGNDITFDKIQDIITEDDIELKNAEAIFNEGNIKNHTKKWQIIKK